ncbi:transposase [Melissospora conviva]|uniref:transposase n=1 Tax=Melissospora conviva TaxID=3388432 RepID=UPI003C29B10D
MARGREAGVMVEQIAKDFGVDPMTLWKWLRQADVEAGDKPGVSRSESAELRELRRRNKLLDQQTDAHDRVEASQHGEPAQ